MNIHITLKAAIGENAYGNYQLSSNIIYMFPIQDIKQRKLILTKIGYKGYIFSSDCSINSNKTQVYSYYVYMDKYPDSYFNCNNIGQLVENLND